MALTGQQFTIAAGKHKVTIAEVGAGLRRYTHEGAEVTGTYRDGILPPKACGITLVPWPNRIRGGSYTFDGKAQQLAVTEPATGNAIHGLGRWARWVPLEQKRNKITLGLDIVPQNGYPFEVSAEVSYALHADRGLTVTARARNAGSTRAPFGAGFHPYLSTRGRPIDETTMKVPARTMLVFDDKQIPVGSKPVAGTPLDLRRARRLGSSRFDDGLTDLTFRDGRATVEVRSRGGGAQLWLDESWRYLQVFTVDDLDGSPAIAVEPMSCAPDAFNSGDGLVLLDPGATWTGTWGITPL